MMDFGLFIFKTVAEWPDGAGLRLPAAIALFKVIVLYFAI